MQVDYDSETNALRLTCGDGQTAAVTRRLRLSGTIDVAEGGRLGGIEVVGLTLAQLARCMSDTTSGMSITVSGDTAYFQLSSGDDDRVRSTLVTVEAELGADDELLAVAIPRRGEGYEISYPSGNQ